MRRFVSFVLVLPLCALLVLAQAKAKPKKEAKKSSANVAEGQAQFKEKCVVCHWPDKTDKRIGPGMKGLYKRAKMFDDRPVTDANVRDLILKGGGKMVGFEDTLEPKQVDALIAYLKTL
jgi:mono/diheme cytochrome c family protein